MPFNGSGVFVRSYSWVNDATNNIPITATRMDADTNDIVNNGLGLCLTRDGQGQPTANLPMAGFKHTGAAPGVAGSDYATMAQISGLAPLASPAFTGTPTAPTATAGTNSTQIATTAFVGTALGNYLPLSGGSLSGALAVNANATVNGALIANGNMQLAGLQLVYDAGSNNLGFRAGNTGSFVFFSMNNNGTFSAPNGGMTAAGNIQTTGGVFYAGSIQQPTIFVQSSTPTARNVGDLWFF